MTETDTGRELCAQAAAAEDAAAASFDRCDTDGFASQWASGITARLRRAQAGLADAGGVAEFPALFTPAGTLVAAKLIEGRYGMVWGLLGTDDPRGRFTGWFNPSRARSATRRQAADAAKGYQVGRVRAPAMAVTAGSGTGLSGALSVYVAVVRSDAGFSRDAETVTTADYREE